MASTRRRSTRLRSFGSFTIKKRNANGSESVHCLNAIRGGTSCLVAPAVAVTTNFSFTTRFSVDNGLTWTYCDLNGAGSNATLVFEPGQLGVMTVTPQAAVRKKG